MHRRTFIKSGLRATTVGLGATLLTQRADAMSSLVHPNETPSPGRMNHLFFIVDDLNVALGCYGHPAAHTPNIDRLAARGTRFANTYCPYPLCGPSRTALLTGQRPESFPMPDNEVAWRDLAPDLRTLPQIFREAGYRTAGFGKIFHHGIQARDLAAWKAAHPDAHLPHDYEDASSWDESAGTGMPWEIERHAQGPEQIIDGRAHGGTSLHSIRATHPEILPDFITADHAIGFLRNQREWAGGQKTNPGDQGFFLGVGFHKPHVPFIAPEKWWAFHDGLDVDSLRPPTWVQPAELPKGTRKDERFHRGMDEEQRQHCYKGYLSCVSWMDEQVGRVLAQLEASGLADTTLVSFVADHGYHIGQQAQWDKMQLLDPALRDPLVLAGPGIVAGQVATATVQSLDLFPTLLDLHGLSPGQPSQGYSLQTCLTDPDTPSARPAFGWVHAGPRQGWTLRTDRHRYGLTSWQGETPEPYLFDYQADPDETTNLLANGTPTALQPLVAELDAQLRAHYESSKAPVA